MRPQLITGPRDLLLDTNVSVFNVDIRLSGLTVTGALEDADQNPVFFALPAAGANGLINLRDPVRLLRFAGVGTATVLQQSLQGLGVGEDVTVQIPPAVLAARTAAAAAPTPGNLQFQAQTVSYLGANTFPDSSFDRHYTSGAGIGTADFFSVTKPYFYPTSWDTLGGPTNGENDGSNAAFWTAAKLSMGTVQNSNPVFVAFQTPSRRVWIPSQATRQVQMRVDGKLLPLGSPITFPSNNNMAKIDFGSVGVGAGRKIVLQSSAIPSLWVAEISVDSGSAIVPYDWHTDTGRIVGAMMGDSYQINLPDYTLAGLPYAQYLAELLGWGAFTQSSIGGTGYLQDGGSADYPNVQSAIRQAVVTRENPTALLWQLGINDPSGAPTNAAMTAFAQAMRTALPNALLIAQTAWSPKESQGQQVGGKWQLLRTQLYATMAGVSGPWIIIDNLAGTWLTSSGKSRGAAMGPWQTGDGYVGGATGIGNGDTWVSNDQVHPTALGQKGLAELTAQFTKEALAAF